MCYNCTVLTPLNPSLDAKPGRQGRAIRVYGQWDNYRTNFDDFIDVYLLGIQLNIELVLGATFLFFEYTVSCRVESDIVP